jgi:hypothetical protein
MTKWRRKLGASKREERSGLLLLSAEKERERERGSSA